ncbi:DNA cytosine methyltransferase [Lactococcus formosensis]|uniref:DNA cytosine methyltransferase n=1 Tax=Lactococcus formosensis TaxID=1281486 RepID=UPI001BCAF979|nr:DNA cytosine methyltransferase [Lactococcus formosensis]
MKGISLFSSIGVAEYYLKSAGIDMVLSCELERLRAEAHKDIYPDTDIIIGDLTRDRVKKEIYDKVLNQKIDLIIATPPCQGVSLAGLNKKEEDYLKDPRNYLVLEALEVFDKLKSNYLLIENVPRFKKMVFPYKGEFLSLEELLKVKYEKYYNIEVVEYNAADFGVPQTRFRIVYRVWKKGLDWRVSPSGKIVSLEDAIGNLPILESGEKSSVKNHFSRKHPDNQILCMRHTPTGKSAFDNKHYFPKKVDGERIKGFNNTYKRMRWDVPAPTVTMRNEIISSQENVHPGRLKSDGTYSDARVLSLRELLIISSLPGDMDIPSNLSERQFRTLIGEGIPPLMLKEIVKGIK